MTCLVCGSRQSESHFGGMSCRACAAFFRRFFNSKKFVIKCTCTSKTVGSHPCRSCRVAKCFAVGMTPTKLCGQRDPNGSSPKKLLDCSSPTTSNFSLLPSISPKDTTNITSTLSNFSTFESKRIHLFTSTFPQNAFAITSLTKHDLHLTNDLVTEAFPDFAKLNSGDKKSMINGFVLKIWQIEPVLDHVACREEYRTMSDEDIQKILFPFFNGSFPSGVEMSDEDVWRIFGHHWTYFYRNIIEPIVQLSLDQIELMAIIWILFFDHAYIDISQKSSELCWNIKKVIHRELKNHLMEKYDDEELVQFRFVQILEVPVIVERGEQKFLDEFLICEMHRVRVHDDFKAIVKKQRF
ncbi:hypothetical protein B9Z55_027764 [Caenorhabditis nigoni]|uniref:Nuclear receptor domain-containing protein n=1 Tax=Caenorhabditis nigoni TaxID=1611254 RepID=A0A2G5SEM8_9PELO|nr:hypothetical protein B9Z55_027764 [Caenorhabditis nigoni]